MGFLKCAIELLMKQAFEEKYNFGIFARVKAPISYNLH